MADTHPEPSPNLKICVYLRKSAATSSPRLRVSAVKKPCTNLFTSSSAQSPATDTRQKCAALFLKQKSRKPRESRIVLNGFVLIRENSRLDF
jgi:hypothetical protein